MTRGATASVGAIAAIVVVGACSATRSGELEPRYVAVHNALAAMGLVEIGPIHQGSLAEGREARVPLELPAQCTTVVALGGAGVRDLDVALLDADDRPIAHDTTRDAQAAVRACPEAGGRFTLVVRMAKGSGDFVAATWSGSGGGAPPAQSAAAAPAAPSGGGTCESPAALAPGTLSGSTRRGDAEHTGGCASSEGREFVYKLEVPRRQRLVVEVDPQFDSVLYIRKDDCAEADAEIACNDDASSGGGKRGANRGSRLDEVLEQGTYFVFVDGYGNSDAGNFKLNVQVSDVPTLADACRTLAPLAAGHVSAQLPAGSFDHTHASCADDAKGPDVMYRLDVPRRARVRAVHHSSDYSPVVHVRKSCIDDRSEVGCSGSGMSSEDAAFVGVLDPGAYTLVADSSDRAAHGRYTLDVELGAEQGTGTQGDACGDARVISPNERRVEGDTFAAKDDLSARCSGQGAPDVVYQFELPRRSRVTARFTEEEGSHVFALYRSCTDRTSEIACSANVDEMLSPGTYWLAVDGATRDAFGRFAFALQARDTSPQEAACRAPPALVAGKKVTGTTAGAGDRFTTSCAGREDAQASPDRVFALTLSARTRVQLLLSTPTWDGVLAVRKSCLDPPQMRSVRTAEVACNNDANDSRHSKVEATLEPGRYFVVIDGHARQNEGAFTLEYNVLK